MKKGFTLIELLAVIVILAIIALIATPIILGIINDARKESNERSVELYASAVRNAVAAYQLTGTSAPTKFSDLDIQYNGNVVCATEELYKDGSFYITGCTVNGDAVKYTYGTPKYEPQYYYFGFDWNGTVGETAEPANPSSVAPTGEIRYLGYDVTDGKVTAAYACFTRNDVEYCLKPNDYAKSIEIIKDAYADVVDTEACSFDGVYSSCKADGLIAFADSNGFVDANGGGVSCYVDGGGRFECGEL